MELLIFTTIVATLCFVLQFIEFKFEQDDNPMFDFWFFAFVFMVLVWWVMFVSYVFSKIHNFLS